MLKRGCKIVLSKDIELLHKFEFGFKIIVRAKYKDEVIVSDEIFDDLKNNEFKDLILKPLVGLTKKEIEEIYNEIKEL